MQSLAVTDVATIRMQTSRLRGAGRSMSTTRNTSGGPQPVQMTAFTLSDPCVIWFSRSALSYLRRRPTVPRLFR
jgi:hypothetical protein